MIFSSVFRLKRTLSLALCLTVLTSPLFSAIWHVEGTGNDKNSGNSQENAFRTLQRAARSAQTGDTVLIGDGIYTNDEKTKGGHVVTISTSGQPDAWITWKARPGTHPEIQPTGWAGILINASYIILDGLTVMGANDSITLADALADAKNKTPNGRFNTNGIFVNGRLNPPDAKPHHIIIRNCIVGKCPGGGITAIEADYITVEDCKVFENAWYMRYGGSGITTLNNWSFDQAEGYHIIVQRNLVWNNRCLVPWEKIGKLSDGNGILLDVTDLDGNATNPDQDAVLKADIPRATKRPEWFGRSLIANNVSCHNGGSGIHTFRTRYVDIINNTTYYNGGVTGYADLFSNNCQEINILNNIVVPRPGGKVTSNNKNTMVRWDYNLYPVAQSILFGKNDIIADPLFINANLNPTLGDFRLKPESPALHSGCDELAQKDDVTGKARPAGSGRDRGAYEQ